MVSEGIEIAEGETKKVISDWEPEQEYIVEISGNDVRISHREDLADRGTTLTRSQTYRLDNLGKDELYIHAHEGPSTVRVNLAAANVNDVNTSDMIVVEGDIDATITSTGLTDTDDNEIDPATEQKQDNAIAELESIDGKVATN